MQTKMIEFDTDLDAELEQAVDPHLRGQRKTRTRVEHVIRDWLRQQPKAPAQDSDPADCTERGGR